MASLTKSPLAFAKTALRVAREALPSYSHPKSPHKFTQPQLFAILALKDFLQTDYRGMAQILREWSDLRTALGVARVPHYTTLWHAEKRLLKRGSTASFSKRLYRSRESVA